MMPLPIQKQHGGTFRVTTSLRAGQARSFRSRTRAKSRSRDSRRLRWSTPCRAQRPIISIPLSSFPRLDDASPRQGGIRRLGEEGKLRPRSVFPVNVHAAHSATAARPRGDSRYRDWGGHRGRRRYRLGAAAAGERVTRRVCAKETLERDLQPGNLFQVGSGMRATPTA